MDATVAGEGAPPPGQSSSAPEPVWYCTGSGGLPRDILERWSEEVAMAASRTSAGVVVRLSARGGGGNETRLSRVSRIASRIDRRLAARPAPPRLVRYEFRIDPPQTDPGAPVAQADDVPPCNGVTVTMVVGPRKGQR